LPIELIKKVVKERAKQNEEQEAAKRPKKTAPASARKSRSR
jgi:hypothetical protein